MFRGLMDSLDDPYSEYYTAEELNELTEQTQGIYFGIGAYVSMDSETNLPKISGVIEGAPAADVDLRANDIIYNNFLKPLINDSKDRDGNIPLFIQFYIVFNITTKFLANMNNRNKRNMNDEELAIFFETARECFKFANDDFLQLNKNLFFALGIFRKAYP